MSFEWSISLLTASLLLGMLIFLEVGRLIGTARLRRDPEGLPKGVSAVESAVFALLGLLIAFTFAGGASRFEVRRHMITQEANAIGTAYLRIDLLPDNAQPEMREMFRHYLDTRLVTHRNLWDEKATNTKLAETATLQGEIWAKTVSAYQRSDAAGHADVLLISALNQMIDIATTRVMETRNHPPPAIYILLALLCLIASSLAGYGMSGNKSRSWLHMAAFAIVLSLTVYMIVNLEFPRLGLIRIDAADQILIDLRRSMR